MCCCCNCVTFWTMVNKTSLYTAEPLTKDQPNVQSLIRIKTTLFKALYFSHCLFIFFFTVCCCCCRLFLCMFSFPSYFCQLFFHILMWLFPSYSYVSFPSHSYVFPSYSYVSFPSHSYVNFPFIFLCQFSFIFWYHPEEMDLSSHRLVCPHSSEKDSSLVDNHVVF